MPRGIEWWVVRVMVSPLAGALSHVRIDGERDEELVKRWFAPELDRPPTVAEWKHLSHEVEEGRLQRMPDGSIGEPLESFATEADAHTWRRNALARYPQQDFRVCLVAVVGRDGAS